MIAVASASVPCTITGEIAFGRMCEARIERRGTPDRARGEHEVVLALGEDRPAQQPREDRDLRHADRDHDLEEPGAEHGHDPDREQQAGDREHDVHQPHHDRVGDPAEVAGDRAEEQADAEADRRPRRRRSAASSARRRRSARTRRGRAWSTPNQCSADGPGQQLPPSAREVLLARVVRRDQRREERDDDEDRDEARCRRARRGCGAAAHHASRQRPVGASSATSRASSLGDAHVSSLGSAG